MISAPPADSPLVDAAALRYYQAALDALLNSRAPFLVGGAFALRRYTGIERHTKDLDLFVLPQDVHLVLELLSPISERTDLKFPHWLGKAYRDDLVVDLIFSSGNGLCPVDERWFADSVEDVVFGRQVRLIPAEEMIWQKAFIMERHRYDGADIIHLMRSRGELLDWSRLIERFQDQWPVLLSHMILARFAFPSHCGPRMTAALHQLLDRLKAEPSAFESSNGGQQVCQGTFLSLLDYLPAVNEWGYRDARLPPIGRMTPAEIAHWTTTFER